MPRRQDIPHGFDPKHFLVAHGADPEAWATKHGLIPFVAACYLCGRAAKTTIPFAQGPFRGLIAPRCKCGHPNSQYCIKYA